jgi:hypothetical protein
MLAVSLRSLSKHGTHDLAPSATETNQIPANRAGYRLLQAILTKQISVGIL